MTSYEVQRHALLGEIPLPTGFVGGPATTDWGRGMIDWVDALEAANARLTIERAALLVLLDRASEQMRPGPCGDIGAAVAKIDAVRRVIAATVADLGKP